MKPKIVYEDEDIIAVDKPAGLLVHHNTFSRSAGEKTLTDWLLENYPDIKNVGDDKINRPGIVHRLDKATSGIMLIAKNQKAFNYLKNLFKNRQIKKTYLAWIFGEPKLKKGTINKPIGIKSGTIKHSIYSQKMSKSAITDYEVIKTKKSSQKIYSFLKITPKTGRTHQIRVHLKSIDCPIVGDALYGPKNQDFNRLMLHAYSLEFNSPDGKALKIEIELPKELSTF